MFNSKITDRNRILQAINWYKNYYYGALNEIYIGVAGTTEWIDDDDPDSVDETLLLLTELIGISKATVDFIKTTVASGADVVYADGSYWDKIAPNNPAIDDYDNIISEGINHLYIETSILYNDFDYNTFRKLSVNHNPIETDGSLCTNNKYKLDETEFDFDITGSSASQGTLHLIGHTSKIILTTGQNLNVGLILDF